jgi:hypothetical protein
MACDCITIETTPEVVSIETTTLDEVIQVGVIGPQGPAGAAGQGVPVGGTTGQVLRKVSSTNYDTEWAAAAAGGASQADDYEVTDSTKGIILKSPNNTRWRVTIDNNGSLLRTALATLILSALMLCGGAQAQVRDLVYGTDNVVVGPTNEVALLFTNSVAFSNPITFGNNADTVRSNLGLPASWLTSATNAGAVNRYLVSAGENGEFVTWAEVPNVIAGSYSLKGDEGDPYIMDATNVMAYFRSVNQWRIYDAESFKAALFPLGTLSISNTDPDSGEYNSTVSATTIEARHYQNSDGNNVGRFKIGGVGTAQWELLAGTDGNTNIIRTNYLPAVSGELVTTTLTNVSAPAARTNLGLGSLATNNSVPSGAAATNSILTADGSGGSSFVASRVQRVTLTNNFAVTNYTDLTVTNGNVPTMTVNLDANSLYVARWSVLLTCGAEGAKLEATAGAGTNGIINQSVAGRLGRPAFGYGDTYFLNSGARQVMSLIGFSGAGVTGGVTNGVYNGVAQFRTGASNTTLFWRFSQNSASNVATTLLSNSIFYVEKLSP